VLGASRCKVGNGAWLGWLVLTVLVLLVAVDLLVTLALADGFSIFITIAIATVCLVVALACSMASVAAVR